MKKLCIALILSAFVLVGCGVKEIPEEHYDLIAEYAAGILVDHAYIHEDRYPYDNVDDSQEKPTESTTEESSKEEESTQKENSQNENTDQELAEMLDVTNVNALCKQVLVTQSYSVDGIFDIRAESGKKFVIMEVEMHNDSDVVKEISTSENVYRLVTDAGNYVVFATGMLNDVTELDGKQLQPGEKYQAILAFSVPESDSLSKCRFISPKGEVYEVER